MDSSSLQNTLNYSMSSIDDNAYRVPDLSLGGDDTSSVSLSPNTPLRNSLLSPRNFSLGSGNFSRPLGDSLSYRSGAYSDRDIYAKCQRLEWELSKEKEEHEKAKKVPIPLVLQPIN
jgi:hypothetical protein